VKSKPIVLSLLIGLSISAVAQTSYSEATFQSHIQGILDGSRARLEAGTYYVSGQLLLDGPRVFTVSPSNQIQGWPVSTKEIEIWGATPNSTDGKPRTRIVHGKSFASSEFGTYATLPSDDPWKVRLPESVQSRIRWVNLGSGVNFTPPDVEQLIGLAANS